VPILALIPGTLTARIFRKRPQILTALRRNIPPRRTMTSGQRTRGRIGGAHGMVKSVEVKGGHPCWPKLPRTLTPVEV